MRRVVKPEEAPDARPRQGWGTGHTRVYSPREVREQEARVDALLTLGMTESRVVAELVKDASLAVGSSRAKKLVQRAKARWALEDEGSRASNRAAAMRRAGNQIARLSMELTQRTDAGLPSLKATERAQLHRALLGWEEFRADLEGTREPVKVDVQVDLRVSQAVMHVIAELGGEQVAELLSAQRELERKAESYEQMVEDRKAG